MVARVQDILDAATVDGVISLQSAMMLRPDSHDDLRAFYGPVLSLRGSEDVIATAADHAAIVTACREATHIDIQSAGHLAPIESPRETADAIITFLNHIQKVSC